MHFMILISTIMFWSLVLKNKKTRFLSCITICMSYHHAVVWHQIQKSKNLDIITQVSIVMHHTSSSHCLFWRNQFTRIILSTPLGLVVLFIHMNDLYSKPSFVLAHQAQLCLATKPNPFAQQAQFCTGPPSPVLHWPPSPISYGPNKPSPVLAHQAQFRICPTSLVLYWSTKPNSISIQQAQFRTSPQSPSHLAR